MTELTPALVLSLTAGAIATTAFIAYNLRGGNINTGTWFILFIGDGLDLWSYAEMTDQDLAKNIVPGVFALGSVVTFMVAFFRKRFEWPDAGDWFFVLLDSIITVLWRALGISDTAANLLYQGTTILAFIPMCRGLLTGREREHFFPWLLWTFACFLFVISTSLELTRPEEMVYPIVTLIVHGLVCLIILMKDNR